MRITWKALAALAVLIGGAVTLEGCVYYDPYYPGGYYGPSYSYGYGYRPYYGYPYRRYYY